jgi:hypothetical protein
MCCARIRVCEIGVKSPYYIVANCTVLAPTRATHGQFACGLVKTIDGFGSGVYNGGSCKAALWSLYTVMMGSRIC